MTTPDQADHVEECAAVLPSLSQRERIDYITEILNQKIGFIEDPIWISQLTRQLQQLPENCCRDVSLTIKARGVPGEEILLESVEGNRTNFLFDSDGVFVVPGAKTALPHFRGHVVESSDTRIIVSSPTWKQARDDLQQFDFGQSVAILPETITIAGELDVDDLDDRQHVKKIVDHNLSEMCDISRVHPDASFVVGSPHFIDSVHRPYNAAFHVKNGHIINVVHKYNGTLNESHYFASDKSRQPMLIQNGSVMICRDLMLYAVFSRINSNERAAQLAVVDSQELLTTSCWGVGAFPLRHDMHDPKRINEYYLRNMQSIIKRIFQTNSNLNKIVIADRLPSFSKQSTDSPIATTPFSMVAFRPDEL